MSGQKKAKNTGQRIKGKVKEVAGEATGNESLRMKGKAEQAKGDAKQVVEKTKDTLED